MLDTQNTMVGLIQRAWMIQEAKTLGITVNSKRIQEDLALHRKEYGSRATYQEYLHELNITEGQLRQREGERILSEELAIHRRVSAPVIHVSEADITEYLNAHQQLFTVRAHASEATALLRARVRQALEYQQKQASITASEQAVHKRFIAQTTCASGYVVDQCSDAASTPTTAHSPHSPLP